ncbi:dihydrodipicolinate synthase family protein [Longispora fulva]|uniref:4-hydroxy-tetrahydrodipicolinate synthase n=1 Tax=Longispora fulva TaxID=619741 RepID=A0A8J7KL81_9ACTN|nr:dihydrodipicolinate synthase family protein [Longispora fulva]MBG6137646.1 4-hydroxy-tetrahydrodipicolinate synthase [Longispora fulva]
MDELRTALTGVVAITVTPFDDSGAFDQDGYAAGVARLVDGGIGVVTPNGNTGEFYALRPAECDRAVAVTCDVAGDRAVVLAGVGHDTATAGAMALAAAKAGARAVMVHQPVHPYQSERGWVDYHRAVADAVPDTGVVCYVRHPVATPAALSALATSCPNVIGVKYAVPDVFALATAVAELGGRLTFSCGLAEMWAPFFWVAGARGFTSGLATVAPGLSLTMLGCLRAGDVAGAMRVWRLVRPLEELRARHGAEHNVSVVKEALAQVGVCGAGVRPPIIGLEAADRAEVTRILRTWGVLPG